MTFDHLPCRQAGACGDIAQVRRHLGTVANRKPPCPARPIGNLNLTYVRCNVLSERRLRYRRRIVVHHQRTKCWHRFEDALMALTAEALVKCEHNRIDPTIDAFAELD